MGLKKHASRSLSSLTSQSVADYQVLCRYITNESFIRNSLNKILSVRLGIRLLCEHHIALNKQSDLKSILFPSNDGDDLDENGADHQQQVDHFVSKYVPTNNGNGGSSGDSTNMNPNNRCWVGIINKKFSPKELVEKSGKLATRICKDKYGVAPKYTMLLYDSI